MVSLSCQWKMISLCSLSLHNYSFNMFPMLGFLALSIGIFLKNLVRRTLFQWDKMYKIWQIYQRNKAWIGNNFIVILVLKFNFYVHQLPVWVYLCIYFSLVGLLIELLYSMFHRNCFILVFIKKFALPQNILQIGQITLVEILYFLCKDFIFYLLFF